MKSPLFVVTAALIAASALPGQTTIWMPPLQSSWQWQLTTPVDLRVNASIYDIDMFDNSASVVASIHAAGRKAVCYIDVGTWENWRPDASQFPSIIKGRSNGWPGEKWLDIRRLDILGPIMAARMSLCKSKKFDAVEPDNIDGYSNSTGFPLTYQQQLTYNKWIAATAHSFGLSVALKNDVEQVPDLEPYFDWTLNEQCFQYQECKSLLPFSQHGKAIFNVEYELGTSQFCTKANSMNFNSMQKDYDLDAWRVACRQ
jgi:hypothetical protein